MQGTSSAKFKAGTSLPLASQEKQFLKFDRFCHQACRHTVDPDKCLKKNLPQCALTACSHISWISNFNYLPQTTTDHFQVNTGQFISQCFTHLQNKSKIQGKIELGEKNAHIHIAEVQF